MRRSVPKHLPRVSPPCRIELCRVSPFRRWRVASPRQQPCSARRVSSLHSTAATDGGQVDANRLHKHLSNALTRAQPRSPSVQHPQPHPAAAAQYETVIGLEVHCQLLTASKLFSRSSSAFGSAPNSQSSFVDAALPGCLPRAINAECVAQCVRTALCLGAEPQRVSRFDRKHYFYADMPAGYQITQQAHPVIRGGLVGHIRVDRVQLEQDSGKCLHDLHAHYSHVDLNRAGMPLIEVVTQPDMRSGAEAVSFVRQLSDLLRHAGVCRAQMEDGSLRCDVNVSVRRRGVTAMGERVEIKNLNSLRSLHRAIQYEAGRQIALCESGQPVQRETRTFDSRRGLSVLLRSKEQLLDYRFMAEPDLPWLRIPHLLVSRLRSAMGETSQQQRARLVAHYGLSQYHANVLVSEQGAVAYFERLVHGEEEAGQQGRGGSPSSRPQLRSPKLAVGWLTSELFGRLRRQQQQHGAGAAADGLEGEEQVAGQEDDEEDDGAGAVSDAEERRVRSGGRREQLLTACTVRSAQLASLIDLLQDGAISGKTAKQVLDAMLDGGGQQQQRWESAAAIVQRLGLPSVARDGGALDEWVAAVLSREAAGVERYVRKANSRFVGFLVGEVLKEASGSADPKEAAVRVRAALQQRVDASARSQR